MSKNLVAICGRIGAGKDTIGDTLVERGYKKISFAGPLKQFVSLGYKIPFDICLGATAEAREKREEVVPKYGESTRQILERVGTVGREITPDFWVAILEKIIVRGLAQGEKYVITDLRAENEFKFVKKLGGEIWCVFRDKKDLVKTSEDIRSHWSRWKFLDCLKFVDSFICNNGDIASLKKLITDNILQAKWFTVKSLEGEDSCKSPFS